MPLLIQAIFTGSVKNNQNFIVDYCYKVLSQCPGLKFDSFIQAMKKKENLWQLLQRLDEEAGQFNFHLYEANRYFDTTATATKKILDKHEKRLHKLIGQVQKAIRSFQQQEKKRIKKPPE